VASSPSGLSNGSAPPVNRWRGLRSAEQRREKILSEGTEWRRRRGDGREIVSARLLMQSPWVGENDERERESEKWDG
jgi:hypothetical protein